MNMAEMNKTEVYRICHEIIKNPVDYLKKEKELTGQKYMGYNCVFPPEEIVHAAGFTPVRIMGFSKKLIKSEKYITSNCCEFARNIIDFLCSDESSYLDGILFSHCCDTLQVVADIAPQFFKKDIFIYNMPTRIGKKHTQNFLNQVIKDFKKEMEEKLNIEISEEKIRESYNIYKENRELLSRLYEIRRKKPGVISGFDSLAVVMAGLFMKKEKHNELLIPLISELEEMSVENQPEKKILLSGIINCNIEIVKLIEESGCVVVDDDLCESARVIPMGEQPDFVYPDTLSKVNMSQFCPVKNYDDIGYSDIILERSEKANVDGIIFIFFPFCDPQFLEYSIVRRKLIQKNIKSLLIEIVAGSNILSQLQTRVEAFLGA